MKNCTHWINKPYTTAFVYKPYYYPNENTPYFESIYKSHHDKQYIPTPICNNNIKLRDGTIIEGFGFNYLFIVFIILLFFVFV